MFIRSLVLDAHGRTEEAIDQAIVHLDAIPPGNSDRFAAREWMARILITTGRTAQLQAIQTELRQLAASGAPRSPVIAIVGGGY
jgi:hypothetical protein